MTVLEMRRHSEMLLEQLQREKQAHDADVSRAKGQARRSGRR